MNLKPLLDRVIIEPAAKEEVSAGGIFLPDSAKEKPLKGTVIAVGPGKVLDNGKKVEVEVSQGDVVLYGKYSGTEVTVDGKEYMILRSDDILGVVTNVPAGVGN
ncbi:MAG: co-chaperone GroES [Chthonomonas sp.]|nr:co-chaperone GroES [Chthonomonas sp.]